MRIGYFGSPAPSACLLERLLIRFPGAFVFVLSNSDTRQGRSAKVRPTPVSALVMDKAHSDSKAPILLRAEDLKEPKLIDDIQKFQADLFVVFAYGKLLPAELLSLPPLGAINLHASLLPTLRGAAPIQTALLQGLSISGWSVQYITRELDAGDIIFQKEITIQPEETAGELMERMLPEGTELLIKSIEEITKGRVRAYPQNDQRVTYCHKIHKGSAQIRWQRSAQEIHNLVRAYNPSPVAWTLWGKNKLRIYRTVPLTEQSILEKTWKNAVPGRFGPSPDHKELWVRSGDGLLSISELQPENRRRLQAREFLNGCHSLQTAPVVLG